MNIIFGKTLVFATVCASGQMSQNDSGMSNRDEGSVGCSSIYTFSTMHGTECNKILDFHVFALLLSSSSFETHFFFVALLSEYLNL